MRFLPPGKLLRQYKILRVLGSGGFGITYLVRDETLDKLFAIKEYYPDDFASRNGGTIRPKTASVKDFNWAKERFIEEARILARFDHPHIVKVVQIFEANNTAYMVQEYESGRDLKAWLEEIGDAPTQLELDCIVEPLLIALKLIHRNDLLHRDIAPDNIYIRDDGTPVLIDFGSAKDALAQLTKNISAVVKVGYSPPELYSSRGRNQGPWSDNYSLAATLYFLITGARPQEATERLLTDNLISAAAAAKGDYRPTFLDAIDWALKVAPKDRPQSVVEWSAALFAQGTPVKIELTAETIPHAGPKVEIDRAGTIMPTETAAGSLEADIFEVVGAVAKSAGTKPAEQTAAQVKAADAGTVGAGAAHADIASQESELMQGQAAPAAVPAKRRSALTVALYIAASLPIMAYAAYWMLSREAGTPSSTNVGTGTAPTVAPAPASPSLADAQRKQDAQAYFAARGNQGLLERYLRTCSVCGYKVDAELALGSIKENTKRALAAVEESASRSQTVPQDGPLALVDHWTSNGSVLELVSYENEPNRRSFKYRIPSEEMVRQGAHEGERFFEGKRANRQYEGLVYQYSNTCSPMSYMVIGTVADDERSISLMGQAPVPDGNCRISGYENRRFVLVFHDSKDNWGRTAK